MDIFKIQLLTQNWIDSRPDIGIDFCSHGKVLLMVNSVILSDENSQDWTVVSSALGLMKSAINGYDSKNDLELIPCCGYLRLFQSCPNYITWDVRINNNNNTITISNIECSKNKENGLIVINDRFTIEYTEYVKQVLNFADKVIEFYSSSLPRKFYNECQKNQYELFWKEFNEYYQILKDRYYK